MQSCRFQAELVAVGLPTNGVNQPVGQNLFPAFEFRKNAVALRVDADARHFFAKPEHRAQLTQMVGQRIDNLAIHKIQNHRTLIDQSDFHSQRRQKDAYSSPTTPAPTTISSVVSLPVEPAGRYR